MNFESILMAIKENEEFSEYFVTDDILLKAIKKNDFNKVEILLYHGFGKNMFIEEDVDEDEECVDTNKTYLMYAVTKKLTKTTI